MDRRWKDLHRAVGAHDQSRRNGGGYGRYTTDDRNGDLFVQQRHGKRDDILVRRVMLGSGRDDVDRIGEDMHCADGTRDQSRCYGDVHRQHATDDGCENLYLHERGRRTIRHAKLR